jgi:hypothetical protein
MKLQKQKPYECFPTVLAMLLDTPVARVKQELLAGELKKDSWAYLIANPYTAKFGVLQARVEAYLAKHLPWVPAKAFKLDYAGEQYTLPASGKGVAIFSGHIVAFEDGLVFDPNPMKAAPIPMQEYLAEMKQKNRLLILVACENK